MSRITAYEYRTVFSLATIFGLRMLGFFLVLPVFSLYVKDLSEATPLLIGLAFGIYGLTQALLQIPFGYLSDRFGRKRIIAIGFIIFGIGSIIAALSDSIYGMVLGRALQGAGAIGSTLLALVADLTREDKRTTAMAIIGMFIGISFSLGLVGGAILTSWVGFQGLFWLTSGLAAISIVVLYTLIPDVPQDKQKKLPSLNTFFTLLKQPDLQKLNISIFLQHAVFSIWIFILPLLLQKYTHFEQSTLWFFYLSISICSFFVMLPFIIIAEKKFRIKEVLLFAIFNLIIAQIIMIFGFSYYGAITLGFFIYMIGFNILEACLPSLTSKFAPVDSRGIATGIYSSFQYLGIFIGGILGSFLYYHFSAVTVYLLCAIMIMFWFVIALSFNRPRQLKTQFLVITPKTLTILDEVIVQLRQVIGVESVKISLKESLIQLTVDNTCVNTQSLNQIITKHFNY